MRITRFRYLIHAVVICTVCASFICIPKLLVTASRKKIFRDLANEDEIVRIVAIEKCEQLGNEEAIGKLVKLLQLQDESTAGYAADALGHIGNPAFPTLAAFLEDESLEGRQYAIRAIEHIQDERVGPLLVPRLEDRDPKVRARAAYALGKIRYEMAIEPLMNCLSDEDVMVKRNSAHSLGEFTDERALRALVNLLDNEEEDIRVRTAAIFGLSESDDRIALERLKRCLFHNDSSVRAVAINALGEKKWPEKVELFSQKLRDDDIAVRLAAASCLSEINLREIENPDDQKRLEKELIGLLDHGDSRFVIEALRGLRRIRSKRAITPLSAILDHPDGYVRSLVVDALGRTLDKSVLPHIRQALDDDDPRVRSQAVRVIARLGTQEDMEALVKMLSVENDEVMRVALEWAIAAMKRQHEGSGLETQNSEHSSR